MKTNKPIRYTRIINNIYYFRIAIPRHLHTRLHSKEILTSLKTSCWRTAQLRTAILLEHHTRQFAEMKTQKISVKMPSELAIRYQQALKSTPDEVLKKAIKELNLNTKEPPKDPTPSEMQQVPSAITELQREVQTIKSQPIDEPRPDQDLPLSTLIQRYIEESKDEWTDAKGTSLKRHQSELAIFLKLVGDKNINSVNEQDCLKYQELLRKWPDKYKSDRDGDIEKYIDENPDVKPISSYTCKRRNGRVLQFLNWCKNSQGRYLKGDVPLIQTKESRKTKRKAVNPKHPFNDKHLSAIFSHKTWTKPKYTNDVHYWAPLLALYTGMRPKEICQLYKTDIKELDKYGWVILVRSNEEDEDENLVSGNAKSEKTGEERGIPLHDELISLGFLDFVSKTKTDQLFPYTFKKGYCDPNNMSTRFNENLLPSVMNKTVNYSFYSFRHRFKDYAGGLSVSGDAIELMMGHSSMRSKMAKSYGDPLGFEISVPSYRNNFTWKELLNQWGVKPWAGKVQNGLE